MKRHGTSHTAKALRDYDVALGFEGHAVEEGRPLQLLLKPARERRAEDESIRIVNAPRAQPEVARRLHPARQVQRRHRRLGLGQVDARLRHPVQRRPAPLPRIAQRLRALDRPAGGPARGRRGLRHPADGGDRAAAVARRPQEHGRDDDRGLALPAPALRQARRAALRQGRHRGAAAERRADRRADPARPRRRARRRARAAGRGEQGRLHRPRQVGQGARPQRTCASTASSSRSTRGRGSTASRSTRSSCRSAT